MGHDVSTDVTPFTRFTQNSAQVYPLPLQDESNGIEANRLHLQHEMVKKAINGLYDNPQLVKDALSPKADGSRRRVLDVGTGPGSWAIDMAKEFPDIDVLAFDLSPPVANKCVQCTSLRLVLLTQVSGQLHPTAGSCQWISTRAN